MGREGRGRFRNGRALRDKGLMLEELIESGREIRGQIIRERYDIKPNDKDE